MFFIRAFRVSGEAHMRKYGRLSFADVTLHIDGAPDRLVSSAKATYVVPAEVLARTKP